MWSVSSCNKHWVAKKWGKITNFENKDKCECFLFPRSLWELFCKIILISQNKYLFRGIKLCFYRGSHRTNISLNAPIPPRGLAGICFILSFRSCAHTTPSCIHWHLLRSTHILMASVIATSLSTACFPGPWPLAPVSDTPDVALLATTERFYRPRDEHLSWNITLTNDCCIIMWSSHVSLVVVVELWRNCNNCSRISVYASPLASPGYLRRNDTDLCRYLGVESLHVYYLIAIFGAHGNEKFKTWKYQAHGTLLISSSWEHDKVQFALNENMLFSENTELDKIRRKRRLQSTS